MSDDLKIMDGVPYRKFADVAPGDTLFFTGHRKIAVETWALDWGRHEFNYELNSRQTKGNTPVAIAIMENTLKNEFLERRVVTRLPIPLSVGFPNGFKPEMQVTLGEVSPQVYLSKEEGQIVAWSLRFMWHRLTSHATGNVGAAKNAISRNKNAPQIASSTKNINSIPFEFNFLRVLVPYADFHEFRILPNGFGVTDVIMNNDCWTQR